MFAHTPEISDLERVVLKLQPEQSRYLQDASVAVTVFAPQNQALRSLLDVNKVMEVDASKVDTTSASFQVRLRPASMAVAGARAERRLIG